MLVMVSSCWVRPSPKSSVSVVVTLPSSRAALNEPSGHNNYYGLVFGGSNLEGPEQAYLYFLIGQDGSYLVKRRVGDAKTDNVVAKTPHASIKKPEANGKSTNVLEVRVLADTVDYAVNGTVVGSTPR